ncbi:uncharacterized protein LOC129589691 [Paramacrobiotus metropolitanus]|uniref:uncharacterized protein LOC129589691 n=1 Tax=Paramacrobiotus metropolitanus TaxID=2943436 RepID=UPI002445E164|nr:uncharacterized protein LOC129589691 [Paramacrobiotus metropolitanus]
MRDTMLIALVGAQALLLVGILGNPLQYGNPPNYQSYPGPPPGYQSCPRPIMTCGPYPSNYDPDVLQGTWYIYRHLLTGPNGINRVYRVKSLGKTSFPGQTNIPAAAQRTAVSFYESENATTCSNMDFLGFTAFTGLQVVDGYVDTKPILTFTYCTVYLNLDQGVWILYRCAKPNLATGYCDTPHVDVRVKQRPDEMTTAKQAEIDGIINWLFAPFCLNAQQIPKCEYDKDKPECPESAPTPDEQRRIRGLAATKA